MNQGTLIAGSVVLAGALIAGAILVRSGEVTPSGEQAVDPQDVPEVSAEDYRLGAADPVVTIVEYSDFECPFCARFHPTAARLVEEYPDQVAWVYRHFPLTSIHAQAAPAALASECVGELAGNQAFWDFGQALFDNQQSLDADLYVREAEGLGVAEADLLSCLEDGRYEEKVSNQFDDAVAAGARGTPFSVLIGPDGSQRTVPGALPYEQLKAAVDEIIAGS